MKSRRRHCSLSFFCWRLIRRFKPPGVESHIGVWGLPPGVGWPRNPKTDLNRPGRIIVRTTSGRMYLHDNKALAVSVAR